MRRLQTHDDACLLGEWPKSHIMPLTIDSPSCVYIEQARLCAPDYLRGPGSHISLDISLV